MDKFQARALRFRADNATDVMKNVDFLSLSAKKPFDILKFDYLRVQEVGVIFAVLRCVDIKLTQSKSKIDRKSRRCVLLKDGILFNMAIPLLPIDEYMSIVMPCEILTEDKELHILNEDTSIPNCPSSCRKFKVRSREETTVVMISVNKICYAGCVPANTHNQWVTLQEERFSIKANKLIKIKSVTIRPDYQHPPQNSGSFDVNIKTQSLTISQKMSKQTQ